MNTVGTLQDISIDYKTNKPKITLLLDTRDSILSLEEIKENKLSIEIKKYRNKRSLDANAYCWILMQKLAEKLNVTKEEIYREAIKSVGTYELLPIKEEAVVRFIESWQHNGLGWVCETTKSKLDGYINVLAYYGSSTYDSKEMNRLIDLIVEECKLQNIETMTPEQLSVLKEEWSK